MNTKEKISLFICLILLALCMTGVFLKIKDKEVTTDKVMQADSTGQLSEGEEQLSLWEINQLTPLGDTITWRSKAKPTYFATGTAEFKDSLGKIIACRYDWIIEL